MNMHSLNSVPLATAAIVVIRQFHAVAFRTVSSNVEPGTRKSLMPWMIVASLAFPPPPNSPSLPAASHPASLSLRLHGTCVRIFHPTPPGNPSATNPGLGLCSLADEEHDRPGVLGWEKQRKIEAVQG